MVFSSVAVVVFGHTIQETSETMAIVEGHTLQIYALE